MRNRVSRGTIERRGKRAYWYGSWEITTQDADGRTIRRHTGAHLGYCSDTTKTQAQQKLDQKIFKTTGQSLPSDEVTVGWFWKQRFIPARESSWSQPTKKGMHCDWDHYLAPALGLKRMAELEPFALQLHFNKLAEKYSKWLVARNKTLLSQVLRLAVDLDFLPKNPMDKVRLPRCKAASKPILNEQQLAQLINLISDQRDNLMLSLAALLGLRAEELIGLTWEDFDGDTLHIRNVAYNGVLYRNTVKRDSSRRDLPLTRHLSDRLAAWQPRVAEPTDLIFPGKDGRSPMWANIWIQDHVQPVAKRLGIERVTFQILRRSFVTRNAGFDAKSTQAIAGHAKLDTTRNIYEQAERDKMRTLIEASALRLGISSPTGGVQ